MPEGENSGLRVVRIGDLAHYDWGNLQNPYNFGNLYVAAARRIGFKFEVDKPSENNLLGIRTDPKTIDKMDEMGDILRETGITELYMAVDEGKLDTVKDELEKLSTTPQSKHSQKPVFNLDFLRKCFMKAYGRNLERVRALSYHDEKDEIPPPTIDDTKLYEQIKFLTRGQTIDQADMIDELTKIISSIVERYPELNPKR